MMSRAIRPDPDDLAPGDLFDRLDAGESQPHRPTCWCNGTGRRPDLGWGVRCNLPQLTDDEYAWVTRDA